MASKEVLYTREGYEEAVERLEYLKTTKRHEIAAKIKAARKPSAKLYSLQHLETHLVPHLSELFAGQYINSPP